MKSPKKQKLSALKRRARRVRSKITGTAERPRMAVTRSLNNMYVQLIDDKSGATILGVSTLGSEMKQKAVSGPRKDVSKELGKLVAEKAKEKGITKVVFDRSGYLYHGRVLALAEGAREGGLEF